MTQLLSLFGEDEVYQDIRGEDDDLGFLPIPGMATALAIRRYKRRKAQGKKFFGEVEDIRGDGDDDLGFLPIPGMTTALAIRALRRRKKGYRGKKMLFNGDIRGDGDDDLGFLPIPGMTTALAIRALRRKRKGKKGKALFFGDDDIRGDDELLGDLRGEDDDLGFAATGAAVATGIFKGFKKFGKSKTFKALQKSKLGKKLSIKRKKPAAKKAPVAANKMPLLSPDQFKEDFKQAVQAADLTVIPKAEIVANQEALQMLTEQNAKSSAGVKRLLTPKNMAIGGGALVGTVILLKVLTRKKPVPVHVGLGTYRGCRK